jgi:hypothetical protein
MIHFQQAMNSVIHGITLCSVHYSDDILPIQAMFENEEGMATCTECDFIKKILDQANHFMFLRRFKIMWLMIDVINDNGYVEFRAISMVDTQVAIGVAYLMRHISLLSVISTVWAAP